MMWRPAFKSTPPAPSVPRDLRTRLVGLAKGQSGESIVEALVSVLIGGMALLMLAVVLASSTRMVADSRATMSEYYSQSNKIAEMTSGGTISGSATLQETTGTDVVLAPGGSAQRDVEYYAGEVAGRAIVSYWAESASSPSPSGDGS